MIVGEEESRREERRREDTSATDLVIMTTSAMPTTPLALDSFFFDHLCFLAVRTGPSFVSTNWLKDASSQGLPQQI